MTMNLQPHSVDVIVQKEFLRNTLDIQYKTAGGVLDIGEFGDDHVSDGYVKAGTAVMQDDDGNYVPFKLGDDDKVEDVKGAGLTANDVEADEDGVVIVGILIAGHPVEDKCTGVDDDFKEAVKGYLRFDV